ncbi:MAG: bifunctional metallophosphatase/5'-nucleotidase [Ignavibacteria bacterium]|nr:bifunctional metallophosphatase/5'-nucleotidase [Ignavibacteria bacterium]
MYHFLRFFFVAILPLPISLQLFSQQKTITILHTNDMHASFVQHEATWSRKDPKPMVGGFSELYFLVDSIRNEKPLLLLDAGDVMTGNPITEYKYENVYGGALFAMMNKIGYDAWSFGNHDFDASQENLLGITRIVQFPVLSANVVNEHGKFVLNHHPYTIIEKNGLRIGIIGIMSQYLYNLVNQKNLVGIKVLSPVETAQKYIDEIDAKTDVLIALTHEGVDDDSLLAENVEGLDVIVGGHSHTRLTKPRVINDVIIVQAGANCENLGELEIVVENDKVTSYDGKLITMWKRDDRPQNALTNFIDSMQQQIENDYSEVIAELTVDWRRRDGESGIGNFISDAQRIAAFADVGFMNNHGIRKDVLKGPLTKKTLFEVLPFQNILTTFQLSGAQLADVLRYYIKDKPQIQTSGILCKWKKENDGIEFVECTINGKPLDETKMYICAASDYFVGEAKRYIGIEISQPIYSNSMVFSEIVKYAREMKTISTGVEQRIEKVK